MPTDTRLDLGVELERRILARQGARADIALVLRQRGDILDQCADLFVAAARETKARIELTITVGENDTFDALVVAGKYNWRHSRIIGERFPVRQSTPGQRKLVLLNFGRDINAEDAIAAAEKQGFKRPTYEDALRFGAQHPDVYRQFVVLFLHEPVMISGDLNVLCLYYSDGRNLDCSWFIEDWHDYYYLAFVCP